MGLESISDSIKYDDYGNKSSDLRKQVTMVQKFILDFDMDLQGHEWSGKKGEYLYTGDCLCDKDVRNKLISVLRPFSSEANLITDLTAKEFSKMKYRTLSLVNEILTTSGLGVPTKNKRLIFNKCMNTLKLVGGIILGSKKDIVDMLRVEERDYNDEVRLD